VAWSPPSNVAPNDILTSTLWNQSVVDNTKAIVVISFNAQTGTTYTFQLSDSYNRMVTLDNASAITATVPTNASVAFEIGAVINFMQKGAGQVTIAPAGGVTLRANQWIVYGNLTT
jgi:hypothetical protein